MIVPLIVPVIAPVLVPVTVPVIVPEIVPLIGRLIKLMTGSVTRPSMLPLKGHLTAILIVHLKANLIVHLIANMIVNLIANPIIHPIVVMIVPVKLEDQGYLNVASRVTSKAGSSVREINFISVMNFVSVHVGV